MSRDDALLKAFASELKARRTILRLSQEELALRAGINRTYVAKIELCKNQPTLSIMFQLAQALECELPVMLKGVVDRYQRDPAH